MDTLCHGPSEGDRVMEVDQSKHHLRIRTLCLNSSHESIAARTEGLATPMLEGAGIGMVAVRVNV